MPITWSPRASSRLATCMPIKPAHPLTRTIIAGPSSLQVRALQLDELRILGVAVDAADRNVQQAGNAVEKSRPQQIELDEAQQRACDEPRGADAAAGGKQLLRLQAG